MAGARRARIRPSNRVFSVGFSPSTGQLGPSRNATSYFTFPKNHGIFDTSLPPRHPPIVAVDVFCPFSGLSSACAISGRCRRCAVRSGVAGHRLCGVTDGLAQPPSASQPVTDDFHGGQGRSAAPSQPGLDLPHLHIDAAKAFRHPPLRFPPAHPLKPADGLGTHRPFPAAADDRPRQPLPGTSSPPHVPCP